MAKQSGLPPKVIKHWFRNTLFKERQRSKDSPYNFSIPPSTTLNLEEYEKTGEAKVMPLNPEEAREIVAINSTREEERAAEHVIKDEQASDRIAAVSPHNKVPSLNQDNSRVQEKNGDGLGGSTDLANQQQLHSQQLPAPPQQSEKQQLDQKSLLPPHHPQQQQQPQQQPQVSSGPQLVSSASSSPLGLTATSSFSSLTSPQSSLSLTSLITSQFETNPMLAHKLPHTPPTVPSSGLIPPSSGVSPTPPHLSFPTTPLSNPHTPTSSSSGSGKRANRTRFTDYQIKVLQEFFENNAYPKDDDLEYLSKLLNLSPRVIVVWFQNARQKARKVYENQPPLDPNDEGAGRFTRTPGLNYQCKKCLLVFQRYYELIRHQKTHCFKEEDAKRSAQAQAAAAQAAALYNDENSNHSSITDSSQQSGGLDNKSTESTLQCDKCSLVFNRFEQWREHQIVHLMNPALFLNKGAESPFTNLQQQQQSQPSQQQHQPPTSVPQPQPSPLLPPASPLKRKAEESEDERESMAGTNEGQRDKRLRTTILPEQLDYLYQKYQMEANPSRKMLETIAQEVGLKKRVVQVWFQNTRARERKGQFRAHAQVINKKCPFCPAIFKVKSALESHLSTKHADQYSKGDVDIDALPDVEDSGVGNFGLSSTPSATPTSQVMHSSLFSSPEVPEDSIAMYHEEAMRRYLNDVTLSSDGTRREGESPLDLSKPLDLVRPLGFDSSLLETTNEHIDDHSDEDSYHLYISEQDEGDTGLNSHESNPTSPASSTTSPANKQPGQPQSTPSKRFRTQMSAIQVKIMKSVFQDYKTPTMAECELLGREIGLVKRVVQVWFQNARAKEKKAKLALQKMLGTEPETPKPPEECKVCNFKYSHKYSIQDHLFTRSHIENMKMFLEKVKDESDSAGMNTSLSSMQVDVDRPPASMTPAAGLAHQLQMAQHLMALGSPPSAVCGAAGEDKKGGPGGSSTDDLSRLQLLQQMYQQMGLGGLQGAPHPLLQHAMMAGAGE
uniref:Zinc finger homeobox protein 4 n=1 Tax=Scylla olivacea TaxID=85551 RepID=A0A0P4WKX8_SCYOL